MKKSSIRNTARVMSAIIAMAFISCSDQPGTSDPTDPQSSKVASIAISPGQTTLDSIGAQVTLTATINGKTARDNAVVWSSADPSIAAVDASGAVTALSTGSTLISATVKSTGQSAASTVNVQLNNTASGTITATVGSVTVTPAADTIPAGATSQYTATVKDAYGNVLTGQTVTWTTTNTAVATINSSGLASGIANGVVEISATAGGKSGYAHLMVAGTAPQIASITINPSSDTIAVGGTTQLTATARDASGNALTGYTFAWSTMNPSIATVNATGLVSGVASGTATISASAGGKIASAPILVSAATPTQTMSKLVLSPDPVNFTALGATAALTATAYDQNSQTMPVGSLRWTTSNSSIATVDTLGRVTSRGVGTALIIGASVCCGKADTVTANVTQVVASVAVSPHSTSVVSGSSTTLSATAYDANKYVVPSTTFSWSTSNSQVATVSNGVVTGVAAGSAVIRAASGSSGDSSVVTVSSSSTTTPPPTTGGVVFQDNFDSGVVASSQNGYTWTGTGANPGNNIAVATERAHSGQYSLRFYMKGKTDMCGDNIAEMDFHLGQYQREVWVEYYVFLQDGTETFGNRYEHRKGGSLDASGVCQPTGPNNNKFFDLWGDGLTGNGPRDGYNGPLAVAWQTWRSNVNPPADLNLGDSRMSVQYAINGQQKLSGEQGIKDPFFASSDRGRWVQIRIYAKTADPGQGNGVMKMWKDGVLTSSVTNAAHYMPSSSPYMNAYKHGYVMGWANSGFTKDTYIFIDDFKIIASNPGW